MTETIKQPVQRDVFAEIAAQRQVLRDQSLVEPQPPTLSGPDLLLKILDPTAVFTPRERFDTPKKLQEELAQQREHYAPFLQNLAPSINSPRIVLPITVFDWRLQTEDDLVDFSATLHGAGDWESVSIPHYGGPLGRATAYYRTTFQVSEEMLALGALFVHFKGVDYKAHVFVNGSYLGSHEGFFAPFEFDCTTVARHGENHLLVQVENDAICMGNASWEEGPLHEGDKIYAATGPGYDDPRVGWHHCPPGMGIYQAVFIEARAPVHVHDLFARVLSFTKEESPLGRLQDRDHRSRLQPYSSRLQPYSASEAEAWIELYNCHPTRKDVNLSISVHGQNFVEKVFEGLEVKQDALGPGVNYLRVPFTIQNPRVWNLETPWLYQLQITVCDGDGQTLDVTLQQFGLRTFRMENEQEPKGRFFLNDREIRLRGANTMGFEQQDIIKGDWRQLIDDILLAKICNMNFWRITQRPVQSEVYEYCDRLGLMTQTDLPLFGCLRRNQFCEAIRQAEEMERLVRSHPCNIMVSYINEPSPMKPHRQLLRDELERFFLAADQAVRLANPDRVIKAVDGDYDPPAPGYPDNHCYCGWYNGHGVDLGKLHKGYWQQVKPGWQYGCGEFGAEGLDPVKVMRKYYPSDWLPQTPEEEKTWTPDRILKAQTGRFHYMWFDTQQTVANWVDTSQQHQAWVTRLMTEAFRRDKRMTSFAIHLFIDAFPSGWMKAIMDVERRPKPSYFAYREALSPLLVNLRADRHVFFSEEEVVVEAWVCNDLDVVPENTQLRYQLEVEGKIVFARQSSADLPRCSSAFQGFLRFKAPKVITRSTMIARMGLVDSTGKVLHDTELQLDIFPERNLGNLSQSPCTAHLLGKSSGPAEQLLSCLGMTPVVEVPFNESSVILVDDFSFFVARKEELLAAVEKGGMILFLEMPPGEYELTGDQIIMRPCGMNPVHFVSRTTDHALVKDFQPNDFRFWYDDTVGYVTPLLATTFTATGWQPILTTGNGNWQGEWESELAVAEKAIGLGCLRICQLSLANRVKGNPVARIFAKRLLHRENR